MQDLDAALNELGMLSNITSYKLEYLQDREAANERLKALARQTAGRSDSSIILDPLAGVRSSISVNSQFVTSINIRHKDHKSLEAEAREKRLSEHLQQGASISKPCTRRHSCPSGHICSFVSPPRSRSRIITIPGSASLPYRYRHTLPSPLLASLPGVLTTSRNKNRFRGRVRFRDPACCIGNDERDNQYQLYPLDDELTTRLASIKLTARSNSEDVEETELERLGNIKLTMRGKAADSGEEPGSQLDSLQSDSSHQTDSEGQQLWRDVNKLEISNDCH